MLELNKIHHLDWIEGLKQLDDKSIDMCMTSPPYWGLRDYGIEGQLGLESHPKEFIKKLVEGFVVLKKKLKKTGSFYLNLGDTYFGSGAGTQYEPDISKSKEVYVMPYDARKSTQRVKKSNWLQPKQLMLMPCRVAIAMQNDGWILRNDIIWAKPNSMPSSVKDRLNNTFEHLFHFVKSKKYYYNLDAIREAHQEISDKRYNQKSPVSAIRLTKTDNPNARQIFGNPDMKLNPLGKNPGDVFRGYSTKPNSEENPQHHGTNVNYHKLGKNPGDFLQIPTQPFPEAHFAVYPIKLCEKPIKSSVPDEVCSKCGMPRFPIVEKGELISSSPNIPMAIKPRAFAQNKLKKQELNKDPWGSLPQRQRKIIGYTKCSCNAPFKPAVVLDIFAGAGTTFVAVKKYKPNAKWIGFEISEEYIRIANLRIGKRIKPEETKKMGFIPLQTFQ